MGSGPTLNKTDHGGFEAGVVSLHGEPPRRHAGEISRWA